MAENEEMLEEMSEEETRQKILVADDEASIRRILETRLKMVGYDVVVAEDGVDIDVTTYNGSKIKGSYDGEVVVETGETQMVKSLNSAPKKAPSVKLVKATVKDVAYFGVLRNRMFK